MTICDSRSDKHLPRFSLRVQEDYLKLLNIPAPVMPYQWCMICPVPLFHVTASHHIFLASFLVGRKLVLMYKWYG